MNTNQKQFGVALMIGGADRYLSSLTDLGRGHSPRYLVGTVTRKSDALKFESRNEARDAADTVLAFSGDGQFDLVAPVSI